MTGGRALWRLAAAVGVGAGICAVVAGSLLWHRALVQDNRHVVRAVAAQADASLSSALLRYSDLDTITAQQLGSGELDAAQFYTEFEQARVGSHYPGMVGVGYVAYVPGDGLAGFVASERADGIAGFSVVPGGTRPFYCVATMADWIPGIAPQTLVSFDLCSLSWVRSVLLQAAGSGKDGIVPEGPLGKRLKSDFVLFSPYYRGTPTTDLARTGSIVGWSAALVDGAALLRAVGLSVHGHSAVTLFAGRTAAPSALVASSGPPRGQVVGGATTPVVAGARWTIRTEVLKGYPGVVQVWTVPLLVLVGGLVLLSALTCLGWMLARGRHRAEQEAHRSHVAMERSDARFESIARASPIGMLETGPSLKVAYLNPRLEKIAGRPAGEILGKRWLRLLHPNDRAPFMARARNAAKERRELAATVRILRPSGEIRTVRVLAAALSSADDADGDRYVASIEDVSEEIALHEQLRHQALHDDLTGLPNRTLLLDRLRQAVDQAARTDRHPAVLVVDVDRFKMVNDSLGHQAGDKLLVQLAERLGAGSRGGETVARLGGDEFAILLPEVTGKGGAVAVAQRVMQALEAPFRVQGRDIVTSVSIGIMVAHVGDDSGTVLRGADAAMHRAKEQGRARFALFHEGFHERSLGQLTLEAEIRDGIREKQFEIFYQPVLDLRSGALTGAEALLRWRHPTRGLLLPDQFIPAAEESGLIVPLGQWAFGAAVAQVARFDIEQDGPRLGTIAVNLSVQQLRSPQLARERRAVIAQHGLDAHRICMELTETLVMDDSETTRWVLQQMSDRGIKIAIDDFGTGYSSLAYLQTLPVSILKIDRRFIAGLGIDAEADAIVTAVVEMAHRLGLTVVAEGVEEDAQRRTLVDLGCDAAQGFLWARPMPAAELRAWCQQQASVTAPPARAP